MAQITRYFHVTEFKCLCVPFCVESTCVGAYTHKQHLPKGACANVVDPMRTQVR